MSLSFEEIMTGEIKEDKRVEKKKKVLILTDYSLSVTGFGKCCKYLCSYLHSKGKYEIVNAAVGAIKGNPDLERTPWRSIGVVDPNAIQNLKASNPPNTHDQIDRLAGYGAYSINDIVLSERPQIVIAQQDIWGIDFVLQHPWSQKIPVVLSTTLDSRPILNTAIEAAKKVKHFWSWADFATQEMKKMGLSHVKTVRGPLDTSLFYRLPDTKRKELRQKHQIPENTFVIGYVFRNQLRKSVPNLLEGFKLFQKENPTLNTKLLLHTHFGEGWNIHARCDEFGINKNDVLTTYACRNCGEYEVKPFTGLEIDCKHCRTVKSQTTTQPGFGISDASLNEVFNLMSVYCHPITSGGQEIPVQQAKLTELITLVTNYSCGEDLCQPEAASFPLDYAEYREPGTEFIKSTTYPSSIAKQLNKVLQMKEPQRREMGQKARQWTIDNFSIEKIGKFFEDFIDNAPFSDYDWQEQVLVKNPNFVVPNVESDQEWLNLAYRGFFGRDPDPGGFQYWSNELAKVS